MEARDWSVGSAPVEDLMHTRSQLIRPHFNRDAGCTVGLDQGSRHSSGGRLIELCLFSGVLSRITLMTWALLSFTLAGLAIVNAAGVGATGESARAERGLVSRIGAEGGLGRVV
ncbi:hypothetical protein OBBRIDRAFT_178388 [Obba rivulosa]|uniref:Uncharacterized protein n=1 Tax=Obba rivulosa TaxID=1052685 RepID=A0A8E2DQU3_9APHY|nr:hypothetical protein OBBRIDRAFT_178388 [Obba rivulosa]